MLQCHGHLLQLSSSVCAIVRTLSLCPLFVLSGQETRNLPRWLVFQGPLWKRAKPNGSILFQPLSGLISTGIAAHRHIAEPNHQLELFKSIAQARPLHPKMANPARNLLDTLGNVVVQTDLFGRLSLWHARDLMYALSTRLPFQRYVHCQLDCGSPYQPLQPTRLHADWVAVVPAYPGAAPGQVSPCNNDAKSHNPASADDHSGDGYNKPSLCVEPRGLPWPNAHPHRLRDSWVLVCSPCKASRARNREWHQEQMRFGACAACRE